jgi:hypothetical protein
MVAFIVSAMSGRAPPRSWGAQARGRASTRVLIVAWMVSASACATQQQTGQAMKMGGTAAVVAGAAVTEYASCSDSPDEHYARLSAAQGGCRPNGSRQTLGAVIAAAGVGTALLGEAIERDANRREAYDRIRAPSPPPPTAQSGARSTALLALPEPPFSPKKPAPRNEQARTHEQAATDASGTTEAAPARPRPTEQAPAE